MKMKMHIHLERNPSMSENQKTEKEDASEDSTYLCTPMSEMVTGEEIFDALSVLADNPQYLADILDGRDGLLDAVPGGACGGGDGSSWPAHDRGYTAGVDKGGGDGGPGIAGHSCGGCCCCGRNFERERGGGGCVGGITLCGSEMNSHLKTGRCEALSRGGGEDAVAACCESVEAPSYQELILHAGTPPENSACAGSRAASTAFQASLPPLLPPHGLAPLNIPSTISNNPAPWTGAGNLGALEVDHGALYRADMPYYSTSGSESGGDTCASSSGSPGYDDAGPPCGSTLSTVDFSALSGLDVCGMNGGLKDLTGSFGIKQEQLAQQTVKRECPGQFNVEQNASLTLKQEDPSDIGRSTACPYMKGSTTGAQASASGREHFLAETPHAHPYAVTETSADPPLSPGTPTSPPPAGGRRRLSGRTNSESSGTDSNEKVTGPKSDRRLRRREQNRQAARRCRQRKKEQSQELVKEYYQLLSANSEMQSKMKILESEKQRLKDIYDAHLATCTVNLVNMPKCN